MNHGVVNYHKVTQKSRANSRQKSIANSRQKSRANSKQEKSIANGRQGEPKDCDRDEAKYEENTAQRKAAASQSAMSSRGNTRQQGRYELKRGEVITTIPTVDVPVASQTPRRHHEDCMTKYNEIQMDKRCVPATVKVGAT